MCTIGAIYDGSRMIAFKQCDLETATKFKLPIVENGRDGIRYVAFTRQGSNGLWASVNNYGVSFVAADAYLTNVCANAFERHSATTLVGDIFDQYRKIVSQFTNAKAAAEFMCRFYADFDEPDIILISDAKERYFIETNNKKPLVIPLNNTKNSSASSYFASTNHFRFKRGGVTFPENNSTYLRLQRAEAILQGNPNEKGVNALLTDQYYGPSVLSICREKEIIPDNESPYYTQATAYFIVDPAQGKNVQFVFQVNGNPRTSNLTRGFFN